jgi:hypothetical protein
MRVGPAGKPAGPHGRARHVWGGGMAAAVVSPQPAPAAAAAAPASGFEACGPRWDGPSYLGVPHV